MKIVINEKEIELKYSFRALMIFENITGKSFNPQTVSDMIIFFYSVVLASDKSQNVEFDDFVDYIDENPSLINEFSEWLESVFSKNKYISAKPSKEHIEEASDTAEKN